MQPHDLDAEASLLGAMIVSPNAIPIATELVDIEDFYRDTHRLVFTSIRQMYSDGKEVDAVTLSAMLEQQGVLERVGGKAFVHTLVEIVPAAANVRQYAEIVRETSVLRQLIRVGNEIAELGYEHPDEARTLLDSCEQKVFAISQSRLTTDFEPMSTMVKTTFERIDMIREGLQLTGVPTGFPDIDKYTGGFQPSNLIVLAARPGVGKTSLALNIAHNIGLTATSSVAVFSLEMSKQEISERMLCSAARVASHRLRSGQTLPNDDYYKLVTVAGELEKAPIYVDDTAGLNVFELRAKARRLASRVDPPLGLVIIDYLQLMMGDGRADNRQQEVANISRSLKQLARELNVPVLAVSQLNRDVETRAEKRPQLSDLRESGAIEQDADLVMFIYEPKDENKKGIVQLDIAKHRNGPTASVRLGFVPNYTKFRTLKADEEGRYDF
ncbi:MAG TPA: replicative DNA helicase [Thermoleophilia bacterium]|nr:replicative DNA helicase [Thermoleophilia bacterium]